MQHDVIMPALGMAQDKGVIIAWRKALGDQVKADDILMEIETDKATMEVEAGHDGFIAELRAGEGEAIPVGDVVAVISERADGVKDAPTPVKSAEEAEPKVAAAKGHGPEASSSEREKPEPARQRTPARPTPDHGRVLASPKAKLMAAKHGIALQALVRQGMPEPIHVADLDLHRPRADMAAVRPSVLTANVASAGFEGFASWAKGESDGAASRARLLATFAAGAWRRANRDAEGGSITLSVSSLLADAGASVWCDPDIGGVADEIEETEEVAGSIQLFDLSGSGLSDYRSDRVNGVALVLADEAGGYRLSLHFNEAEMPLSEAARFLSGFSARLADPLRQLL